LREGGGIACCHFISDKTKKKKKKEMDVEMF